jgi:predicted dehydrogenase
MKTPMELESHSNFKRRLDGVNVGVIGCERWGPNHVRNFNSVLGSRVVVVADVDSQRLASFSSHFPTIQTTLEPKELFENRSVDAVVIATPTKTHYHLTRKALLAGKHVLCEKPLCETSAQAEELVNLAVSRGLTLMVGYTFLFNPGIIKIKSFLKEKVLGRLHYLSATRTNLGPIRSDVNAAYDLATHDISIFNWLLESMPESVSAVGESFLQKKLEDVVFIALRYPGKIVGHIHASWLNPKKVRKLTIVGSEKMITWDDLNLNMPVALYDKGAKIAEEDENYGEFLRISMWDGDVRLPKVNFEEPLKAQARAFIETIRGNPAAAQVDGKFNIGVMRVLEAIQKSIEQGGAPVSIS